MIPENIYENNKFELIFDEAVDGEHYREIYQRAHRNPPAEPRAEKNEGEN